jgi:hypothetical protein
MNTDKNTGPGLKVDGGRAWSGLLPTLAGESARNVRIMADSLKFAVLHFEVVHPR